MDLPVNVSTGEVVGRYIADVIDGADTNLDPDARPVRGRIVFTASVPYLPNPTAAPAPVTIMRVPIIGVLDADGYLCTPYPGTLEPQYRGVRLIATDDPDLSVEGWTWDVTYMFDPIDGYKIAIPAHGFTLPSGTTVDLTKVAKVPSSPGYSLPQAEAAALRAEEAALSSAQDSAAAVAAALRAEQAASATDQGITEMLADPDTQSGGLLAGLLGPKADAQDVDLALSGKADRQSTESALLEKADKSVVGDALNGKVDVVDVMVAAGDSAFTDGYIVKIGRYAYVLRPDVNMSVVQGGGALNENAVGGNFDNVNTSTSNLKDAPTLTGTDGMWNFILSGYDNVVNGWACVVNGYHNRVAQGGNHATISGGSIHTIRNCNYATIGGGTGHEIAEGASGSTIGGGIGHKASNTSTTIAGGNANEASGMSSTIGGGRMHKASGSNSTVSGGDTNQASGTGAVVPGGLNNTAAGLGAVATGRGANAFANGMRAHGSMVLTPGDAQDLVVNLKRDTTTPVASGLSLDGSGGLVIPVDTTWAIEATVVARRIDADGESAAWRFTALMKRDAGNTAGLIGAPTITPLGGNAGNTWSLAVSHATAGNLNITVTGEDGKTIRWLANLRIVSVSG